MIIVPKTIAVSGCVCAVRACSEPPPRTSANRDFFFFGFLDESKTPITQTISRGRKRVMGDNTHLNNEMLERKRVGRDALRFGR